VGPNTNRSRADGANLELGAYDASPTPTYPPRPLMPGTNLADYITRAERS